MASILVVDDSKIDLKGATMLLEGHDPSVSIFTAEDGVKALEAIERSQPNVIVTDLQMPNMNGLELVVEVRKRFPLIPVVLMTAAGNEQIAAEALAKGAASYVPKRELAADLALIVGRLMGLASEKRQQRRLVNGLVKASFKLDNDRDLLSAFVHELRESFRARNCFSENDNLRLTTAVDEALANAYFHGNLEVSSELREKDAALFYDLAEERQQQSPYNQRRIFLKVNWERNFSITIQDEGPGFEPGQLPDPLAPGFVERPCGRGLLLMRAFMDQVEYNSKGNEVTLMKKANDDFGQDQP